MAVTEGQSPIWKETKWIWGTIVVMGAMLGFAFYDGLKEMVRVWGTKEEYSYGYLIPFLIIFLVWQKKEKLERLEFSGSWPGVLVALVGVVLFVIGNLATLFLVVQYSFVVTLAGLVLAFTGWKAFKIVAVPLMLLFFMIPLPQFFLQEISNQLQLISSQLGVWVIRLFGIAVFLEGNVIDLGTLKLQVVEACSGLRYLFPLLTLGFIAAYFFKQAFWKRAVVFLSAIPITVFMNSFRIGMIGILVEYYGKSMAEGFLHDFEGWFIFMACTAILVGEMWLLSMLGADRRPFREVFGMELPARTPLDAQIRHRSLSAPYLSAMILLIVTAVVSATLPRRIEVSPPRQEFSEFPMHLGLMQGQRERLDRIYIDYLKFDDYFLADYTDGDQYPVNFYVAYYASQRKGESAHSPRTCIPGGGWEIKSLSRRSLEGVMINGRPLAVNRVVIQRGEYKQLVYYWFQERGRDLTNEYLVKWFIFWDALTRNRTDGALVRLTTGLKPGEDLSAGDRRLTSFAKIAVPELKPYIPD